MGKIPAKLQEKKKTKILQRMSQLGAKQRNKKNRLCVYLRTCPKFELMVAVTGSKFIFTTKENKNKTQPNKLHAHIHILSQKETKSRTRLTKQSV